MGRRQAGQMAAVLLPNPLANLRSAAPRPLLGRYAAAISVLLRSKGPSNDH